MTLVLLTIAAASACTVGDSRTAEPAADEPPASVSETTSSPGSGDQAADTSPEVPTGDGYPQPCVAADLKGAIAPGESGDPKTWTSSIVVTSRRSDACVLDGASQVEFRTGGSGAPLGIAQVTDAAEPSPVVLVAGEQAAMNVAYSTSFEDPPPGDCLADGQFADIRLPGNQEVLEAWFPDRELSLPPVCGAVQTSAWHEGGAPGVSPN